MAHAVCEIKAEAFQANREGVRLQCPACSSGMDFLPLRESVRATSFACPSCSFQIRNEKGIWQALAPKRLVYFSQFVEEYETIRAAEGRGSLQADFYLNLPYKDLTNRNSWQWKIRARTFDYLIQKLLPQPARGNSDSPAVLDLGAGNGWMSYRLARRGYKPVAVDLLVNDQDGLGAAVHFEKALGYLFPRFRAEMSRLPFADQQFDAVIFNASFHYAEDYRAIMREAMRCTKEEGVIIIADSPWYSANEGGERMVAERHIAFARRYGTASNSIQSLEYLTDERLNDMENTLGIRWEYSTPYYGLKWTMRPFLAKLRGKREPSRFRIYSVRKNA